MRQGGNMLKSYLQECVALQKQFRKKTPTQKLIVQCQNALNPNDYPLSFFDQLEQKTTEPMQIAIVGQFSSGKSTFLNALLGEDILPTGVTPITAKVCKICYGEDYVLEILYKDGRKVLQNVEFLHKLTRKNSRDIHHFCLYAPILLLREINFLDTPGFNSQNSEDTDATLKVLEQVDGIIWLTLIDNAGKNSEKMLLKEFRTHFAQKILCVLNQKDRLKNAEEIQTSVEYVKSAFHGIFTDVIPVSAKFALKAVLSTPEKFLEHMFLSLAHSIEGIVREDFTFNTALQSLQKVYADTQANIQAHDLKQKDFATLMQSSNMPAIFAFLDQNIKPQASLAKSHSALKHLKEMHVRLHLQYHKISQNYRKLQNILSKSQESFLQSCAISKEKEQKIFSVLYLSLDAFLDHLAQRIFHALQKQRVVFHKRIKTLFGIKTQKQEKDVVVLPLESIRIALQNEDSQIVKDYKAISVKIKNFLDVFVESIGKNIHNLTEEISLWQESALSSIEPYIVAPQSQALQDLQHFIWHCYENILVDFKQNALNATSFLRSELNILSNFLSLNYSNATDLTLVRLDLRIKNALVKHQENQEEFALFNPTLENVRETLNDAFCFEQFQARLFGPMNSLNKAYGQFLEQTQLITHSKQEDIGKISLALKAEMDKIAGNLKAIAAQFLAL